MCLCFSSNPSIYDLSCQSSWCGMRTNLMCDLTDPLLCSLPFPSFMHSVPHCYIKFVCVLVTPPLFTTCRANQADVACEPIWCVIWFSQITSNEDRQPYSVFYALAKTAKSNLERDFFIHKTIGEYLSGDGWLLTCTLRKDDSCKVRFESKHDSLNNEVKNKCCNELGTDTFNS